MTRRIEEIPCPMGGGRAFIFGSCTVISRDLGLWHLSISHRKRYPDWNEIRETKHPV